MRKILLIILAIGLYGCSEEDFAIRIENGVVFFTNTDRYEMVNAETLFIPGDTQMSIKATGTDNTDIEFIIAVSSPIQSNVKYPITQPGVSEGAQITFTKELPNGDLLVISSIDGGGANSMIEGDFELTKIDLTTQIISGEFFGTLFMQVIAQGGGTISSEYMAVSGNLTNMFYCDNLMSCP